METQFKIIPIFPTALYTNILPEQLVLDHIPLLDSENMLTEKDNISADSKGERSSDSYILSKESYKNLSSYILQHSTNYVKNYTPYAYKDFKFLQSWVSIKQPHHTHTSHFHANSFISGLLFYGESIETTSNITFQKLQNHTHFHHPFKTGENFNDFTNSTVFVKHKPNLLILFPSTLYHSVSENTTNIPRKSLSFNIVPKEGFGLEETLTQLKFN